MPPEQQCRIALHFQQNTDRRRYQNPDPSVREIAVILPGDGDTPAGAQDIILYRRNGPLFRITDSHPSYPSLRYVLLFPTGQNQWHPYIPFNKQHNLPAPALPAPANEQDDLPAPANDDDDLPAPANDDDDLPVPANEEDGQPAPAIRETFLSLAKYFRYRLHVRPTQIDSHHLFLAGKLFQEYVCEAWAVAEQKRLGQLKHIQGQLRSDIYQGLADAVAANDTDLNMLGKRFILPSSFSGGTRHLQQQCQDALAINRYFEEETFLLPLLPTLPGQKSQMPSFRVKQLLIALTWWCMSFMPSSSLSSKTSGKAYWVIWLATSTPLNSRRGVFLMPTSLSFLSPMPSCALPTRLTASCHLSFLLAIQTCLSSSKSLWSMGPVVNITPTHLACRVAPVLRGFLSPLESTPQSLMTLMQGLGAPTLAKLFKLDDISLTTDGSFATASISSGSTDATSMWSLLRLLRPSNIYTNISTSVMITPPWSLAPVLMKLSSIWMPDISVAVKQAGTSTSLICISMSQLLCALTSIFPCTNQLSLTLLEM